MSVFAREINDLLGSVSRPHWTDSASYGGYHQQSNENEHLFEIPLVGISKDNVKVDIQEGMLTISAITDGKARFGRNFKQSWILTKDSDIEAVAASLENGLLIVRVPRAKPVKKVINVNVV
jgi:HSP20 family molecular chaperone IbpA